MISFNHPPYTGNEDRYVLDAMRSEKISGDGNYTRKCQCWFEHHLECCAALLVPSCTQALEMAAILIGIEPGDEVIMPSYTFVSTANAFVLRGAKIVFVDIRPDTMNLDERLVEAAITPRTKAIVPVHYAGVGCEMGTLMALAERYGLCVIEDAAQGMMSTFKGRRLGSMGHLAAYSFHETKNFTSGGEGGLLIINDERFVKRAEIIREKGTNRSQFFRGQVDKYSWVDLGSSYLPCDIQAAYLWGQLQLTQEITHDRLASWNYYREALAELRTTSRVEFPFIPQHCGHNGHMFYLKVRDLEQRTALLQHLHDNGVYAVFHYVPLHSSQAGTKFSRFHGTDTFTTKESERLLRLPMWYGIEEETRKFVVDAVIRFFSPT
jgi:dTDP-4-amino-4,6-dideoxygalactose transaminase